MDKNKSIEQVLESLDNKIVYKTKNPVWFGFLFTIPGIASLVIYSSFEWEINSIFAHFLFITGLIFIIIGIIKCFYRKNKYVSVENNSEIRPFTIYFHVSERAKLINLLETGNLAELKALRPSIVDGLKLSVLASKDGLVCYSQVIAYQTNEYVNITGVIKHTSIEYQILNEIIRSRK